MSGYPRHGRLLLTDQEKVAAALKRAHGLYIVVRPPAQHRAPPHLASALRDEFPVVASVCRVISAQPAARARISALGA
jgi:hypothetical protein